MQYKIGQVFKNPSSPETIKIIGLHDNRIWTYGIYRRGYAIFIRDELERDGWYPVEEVKEIEQLDLIQERSVDMCALKINELVGAVNHLQRGKE